MRLTTRLSATGAVLGTGFVLYNRLKTNPDWTMPPRTFFFAGKAAPARGGDSIPLIFGKILARSLGARAGTAVARGVLGGLFRGR